jgi:RimJ/RimL family protein N-acetyltransferase
MPSSAPTPAWVSPVTLEGTRIRLEPLAERHFADLAQVARDDRIFRWITGLPMDEAALRSWFEAAQAGRDAGGELPFATVEVSSGRAIGSSRYMTITPEHRRLEIGWTWLGTTYQRTGINREAKYLQLRHAFEDLGARRVEFKTHAKNERSRAALLGLGATFEGVLRQHTILADGSSRDSAYYSVLDTEWPAVRARLEASLSR